MKLAEKIGYVLEHLIILQLQNKSITVKRSEKPSNETIKGDISFKYQQRKYIVFSTHTRTQGMTNRKFYRSFEELAQRRVLEPKSICIDVSLVKNRAKVRKQQTLIFDGLFDATFSVIPKSKEKTFIQFVKGMGKKVSIEATKENLDDLPKSIADAIENIVEKILNTKRNSTTLLAKYWEHENTLSPGAVRVDVDSKTSVKKGMKSLSLLPPDISLSELTQQTSVLKRKVSKETIAHLKRAQICTAASPSLKGTRLALSPDAWAALEFCIKQNITLSPSWFAPYLTTKGAKRLHSDLMDFDATSARTQELHRSLNKIKSVQQLKRNFWKDYNSTELRCDLVDLAIRSSGYSQNELSLDVVSILDVDIHVSDCLVYIVGKSADADSVLGDVKLLLETAAELIWSRCGGTFESILPDEFYSARLTTFYANAFVAMERMILDSGISAKKAPKKTRQSVLPRIVELPAKYRMSMVGERAFVLENGQVLFVKTVSTPDPRHHKHKEFSGKIRATRYDFSDGCLQESNVRFVCVVDGNWTEDQLSMLANAGWDVFGWDEFSKFCDGI